MVSKKKIKYRIFCIKRDMGVRLKFLRNKKELRRVEFARSVRGLRNFSLSY